MLPNPWASGMKTGSKRDRPQKRRQCQSVPARAVECDEVRGSHAPRFADSFMGTTYEGTISPHQNRRATVPLTHWREGSHQAIHKSGAIRELDGGSESEDR